MGHDQGPQARGLAYWASQSALYAPPHGRGFVRFTARRQHAAVLKLLSPRGGERVLDAGCGSGLLSRELSDRGAQVWAVDFAPEMIRLVTGAARVICADLETLALGVEFDAAVCAGALNFVDAPRVLSRLSAHLRPGGVLVAMVTRRSPAGFAYALSRRLKRVPFQLWSEPELIRHAAGCGLRAVAREPTLPHDLVLAFSRQLAPAPQRSLR